MPMAPIDVAVLQDHAAVMVLKFVAIEEVLLVDLDSIPLLGQMKQSRARAVTGRAEDIVASDDWRWNVRRAIGNVAVTPEKFAVAGPHADDAAADELHVLLHAAGIGNDDRRVSRSSAAAVA